MSLPVHAQLAERLAQREAEARPRAQSAVYVSQAAYWKLVTARATDDTEPLTGGALDRLEADMRRCGISLGQLGDDIAEVRRIRAVRSQHGDIEALRAAAAQALDNERTAHIAATKLRALAGDTKRHTPADVRLQIVEEAQRAIDDAEAARGAADAALATAERELAEIDKVVAKLIDRGFQGPDAVQTFRNNTAPPRAAILVRALEDHYLGSAYRHAGDVFQWNGPLSEALVAVNDDASCKTKPATPADDYGAELRAAHAALRTPSTGPMFGVRQSDRELS